MIELIDVAHFLEVLGAWSLLQVWLPLAAWTLVAWPVVCWLDRADRSGVRSTARVTAARLHPLVQVRIRQALLFGLPAGIAAGAVLTLLPHPASIEALPALLHLPEVTVALETSAGPSLLSELSIYHALGCALLFAAGWASVSAGRLLVSTWMLHRLRRRLTSADASANEISDAAFVQRACRASGIRRNVRVVCVDHPASPLTFGFFRPLIVLPAAIAEDAERVQMTLLHELIHIRRHDFAIQWMETFSAALFAIHPLITYVQRSIAEWRERSCDAAVLEDRRIRPVRYARLLRDLAVARQPQDVAAVALSEHPHTLKSRIEAMQYANSTTHTPSPRFAGLLSAALALTLSVSLVACSDMVTTSGSETGESAAVTTPQQRADESPAGDVFKAVDTMPQFEGGNKAGFQRLREELNYPDKARQDGVEGTVVVKFIVEEDGSVARPTVVKGVHPLLDKEALRVTRELQFEPGRRDGKAVKVQMSLPIRFKVPS